MVAKTLKHILDNPIVSASLDRSRRIDELIAPVMAFWEADLEERRPAPAYIKGVDGEPVYQGTDMDMITVLMALSQRRAVVNIPNYERLRKSSLRSNQYVVSGENRHGQIIRPVSHLDTHSFSVLIKDFNVIETKKGKEIVGAPRNFSVVDDHGELYDGWESLEWRANKKEEEFIKKHKLEAYRDTIEFRYFVHPALAASFYGSYYLSTKALAIRIADQAAHYKKVAQYLRKRGIRLPPPKDKEHVVHWKEGDTKPISVQNLEARLILPPYHGKYPIYGIDEFKEGEKPKVEIYKKMPSDRDLKNRRKVLRYALWASKKLVRKYGPMVRFPVRAVELAFFLYGIKPDKEKGREIIPGWEIPKWQKDYIENGGRINWNMLEFNPDVKLIYRIRETTARTRILQESIEGQI